MSLSQYLLGAAELAVIAAALGLGAYYARAVLVPAWTGALARLAEIVMGISALVVIAELLGLLKLLEEIPLLLACTLVGLGVAYWARGRDLGTEHHEFPAVRPSRAMTAVAIVVSALVVAHWAEPSQEALDTGMYYQDTTWYHMSFSGRFAQTGEVGPLHLTDPLKLTAWYYPQNSELLHAIPMVALITSAGFFSFGSTLYVTSLTLASTATVAVVGASSPIFTGLLSPWITGERPGLTAWAAAAAVRSSATSPTCDLITKRWTSSPSAACARGCPTCCWKRWRAALWFLHLTRTGPAAS